MTEEETFNHLRRAPFSQFVNDFQADWPQFLVSDIATNGYMMMLVQHNLLQEKQYGYPRWWAERNGWDFNEFCARCVETWGTETPQDK